MAPLGVTVIGVRGDGKTEDSFRAGSNLILERMGKGSGLDLGGKEEGEKTDGVVNGGNEMAVGWVVCGKRALKLTGILVLLNILSLPPIIWWECLLKSIKKRSKDSYRILRRKSEEIVRRKKERYENKWGGRIAWGDWETVECEYSDGGSELTVKWLVLDFKGMMASTSASASIWW
jgi:hypothetical protein